MMTLQPSHEIETLPTLPIVVARLMHLYASEDYGMQEIVSQLETDPSVSGRLLRLANSAYYGVPREVDTLHRAVVLLGGVIVQGLALGMTVFHRWNLSAAPEMVREIWVHSYLCASGCRYVACRLPSRCYPLRADTFFLAGLFHDVGKIIFLASAPGVYGEILEHVQGEELRREEREGFGKDHAEIGGELLGAWGFPENILCAVSFHHRSDLRADLLPAWRVTRAVHRILAGDKEQVDLGDRALPDALMEDLARHLEAARPKAEAFYEAIA